MRYTVVDTAWGAFGFVTRDGRVVETYLPQSASRLRRAIRASRPEAVEDAEALPRFRRQVTDYFNGKPIRFSVNVDLSDVSPFRQVVLEACHRIPYGKTATYADLAMAVGQARSDQGGRWGHGEQPAPAGLHPRVDPPRPAACRQHIRAPAGRPRVSPC